MEIKESIIEEKFDAYRASKSNNIYLEDILSIKIPFLGYGPCRSCGCRFFVRKHDQSHLCKNCNHHFNLHKAPLY